MGKKKKKLGSGLEGIYRAFWKPLSLGVLFRKPWVTDWLRQGRVTVWLRRWERE